MLAASREEALLAVDLYNSPNSTRNLEAFYVHMHIAWLYLLHASFARQGIDFHYRDEMNPRRFVKVDGEPKAWELSYCAKKRWPPENPVRANLEFSILIRNKIEHRYESALAALTAGHAQALLMNYESELVAEFGVDHSVAHMLRFPVFLSTFSDNNFEVARELRRKVPKRAQKVLTDFESALSPTIQQDSRFEFRLRLTPVIGPKSTADLALQFVSLKEMTDDDLESLDGDARLGRVISHEKQRPVANLNTFRPEEACQQIARVHPYKFTIWNFIRSWKHFKVRPGTNASEPQKTDEKYCLYDRAHKDYVYTKAFIKMVVRKTSTPESYLEVFGKPPEPK